MVKSEDRQAIEYLKGFLRKRNIKVNKIVIFGSRARGKFNQNSDMDIAVISKDFEGKGIFKKALMLKGLKWFLAEKFSTPFDIIPMSPSEWNGPSLIAQFAKQGFEIK